MLGESNNEYIYYLAISDFTSKKVFTLNIRGLEGLVKNLNDGQPVDFKNFKGILPKFLLQGLPTD